MPLLEIAQTQTFDFANESKNEVEFEAQLPEEDTLSLIVSYDDRGNEREARLRLNSGDPEKITLVEAKSLISDRARQQQREEASYWRNVQGNDPPGERSPDPDSVIQQHSRTVERVIFPVEETLDRADAKGAYVPAERGAATYFRLEEMRHDIVVGAASPAPADPVEAAAKVNYYQGQADLYNKLREGLIRDDPSLEVALPWEIKTEAIQAPEIQEDRERTKDLQQSQALAMA